MTMVGAFPCRGFGHSWPGHLLPTDPARYSARCGADPGPNAHRLSSLELRLPPGWQWRGRWRVDVAPSQWAEPGETLSTGTHAGYR